LPLSSISRLISVELAFSSRKYDTLGGEESLKNQERIPNGEFQYKPLPKSGCSIIIVHLTSVSVPFFDRLKMLHSFFFPRFFHSSFFFFYSWSERACRCLFDNLIKRHSPNDGCGNTAYNAAANERTRPFPFIHWLVFIHSFIHPSNGPTSCHGGEEKNQQQ